MKKKSLEETMEEEWTVVRLDVNCGLVISSTKLMCVILCINSSYLRKKKKKTSSDVHIVADEKP